MHEFDHVGRYLSRVGAVCSPWVTSHRFFIVCVPQARRFPYPFQDDFAVKGDDHVMGRECGNATRVTERSDRQECVPI